MRSTNSVRKQVEVPAKIPEALQLDATTPLHWEVTGSAAVMRTAGRRVVTVDSVFGMLKPYSKRKGEAPTPGEMRAAAKAHFAARFRQSQKDIE